MKNKNLIVLNGASYNLIDGQLVNISEHSAASPKAHNISLARQRGVHHIARRHVQKSSTLRREGLAKPHKAQAKNIKSKSVMLNSGLQKKTGQKNITKSVFVRKFATSHNVLVRKNHHMPVARPLSRQLAHHNH